MRDAHVQSRSDSRSQNARKRALRENANSAA
jgi:hypothetical protein